MTSLAYEARLSEAQAQFLSSCPASGPAEEQVPTEEQPSDRQFTFLTAEEVLELKAAPWCVKDMLPAAGLAAIFGQPGSGKTFLALDMAFAVAEGRDWFGMQTHSCPVVYVNLESNFGLKKRILAWQKDRGRAVPQNVRFVLSAFHILEDVEALARGIEPGTAICIDTLNASAPDWMKTAPKTWA